RCGLAAMTRRLLLLAGAAVVAAFVYPIFASAPNLDRAAVALALAGPAAGAAVAAAAGGPPPVGAPGRRGGLPWLPRLGARPWWPRHSPGWAPIRAVSLPCMAFPFRSRS